MRRQGLHEELELLQALKRLAGCYANGDKRAFPGACDGCGAQASAHGVAVRRGFVPVSKMEISPRGLHWEELDEDISVDGLLAGIGVQTGSSPVAG